MKHQIIILEIKGHYSFFAENIENIGIFHSKKGVIFFMTVIAAR